DKRMVDDGDALHDALLKFRLSDPSFYAPGKEPSGGRRPQLLLPTGRKMLGRPAFIGSWSR
ncbi:MAG: hypothetical protein J0J15_18090, partial [Mesorhizobium sp.]|nr:hypothetical protein [Mesorhizobium sp.]